MYLKSINIYKDTLLRYRMQQTTTNHNLEPRKREDRIEKHIRMIRFKRFDNKNLNKF